MRRSWGFPCLILLWAGSATMAGAQAATAAPVAEFRATVPTADWPAGELGAGLSVRAGWYVRISGAVLGGALRRPDDTWTGTTRAEAALRFHLDPFSQAKGCGARAGWCRGLYGGLGVSQRWRGAGDGAETPVFLVIVGVEGEADPRRAPVVWGLEAALGGGLRLGATARWRRADGYR